ncbi:hypothetical protein LCI18_000134 [Fusarium solani-melongenae]|uniref:Uncharacterized protein n=1 Tax=Fusarium solani subsp. cucurbitae TaxID=2747967 RepID=A0ACD3YK15_FUSSC|nr:hypothetical protein LCI18_000134 [Fusarium solani-melongenae]
MVSTRLLASTLALLAVSGVSAGPCRPSTTSTLSTVVSETTSASSASETSTVSVSETETASSTISTDTSLTSTLTETVSTDSSVVVSTTTTASTETSASSTESTTASASATQPPQSCSVDADCTAAGDICVDAVCAPGPSPNECTTDADCDGATPFCDAGTCVAFDPNSECSTNADCQALNGGANPFCDAGTCVATDPNATGCSVDSDCPPGTSYQSSSWLGSGWKNKCNLVLFPLKRASFRLLHNIFRMATKSPPADSESGHGSQHTWSNSSRYSSGSQPHDMLGSIKDSRRSVTSTKPFVDYNSLVEYATTANIEIIERSKLQITKTMLGAGVNMTVFRGSCVERFGDLSPAIKKYNAPILRGSSDLPQFTDEWMDQLAVMSLELRVLSDHLLRSHPNIVRLLDSQNSGDNKSSEDKFFKPILILEEAHLDYPTLGRFYAHSKAQGYEIPTGVKVALWTGIGDVLSAVHIVGVVHGDIKPDNILLFEDPSNGRLTAKLSDFGGCQLSDDSDNYDRYQLLGTEYWNAPEAYDYDHPHHRFIYRDIYSFGLLGFYILFGSPPFGNPEERASRESERLYNFKSSWSGLSSLVVTILGRQWPQAMTEEAHKHLKSLPQATDIDSFRTRLASYRSYMENDDVQIGIRTKSSRPDALFGIRISEHPDYRPFTMALAVPLFIHSEPEKRDQWKVLRNLSIFLNDKGTAMNLRDIYGSECWQYVLELLDTDKFQVWQLSVPESLRSILKQEYEGRLRNSAPSERIDCLLALASLSIDTPHRSLAYHFEAAQLGSQVARIVCCTLGPAAFAHCNAARSQIFNKWALESSLSSMKGIVFLETLEKACPSILESKEVRMELTVDRGDFCSVCEKHGECSPWIPDSTPRPPEPALAALKAVVTNDFPGLHKTIAACNSVLDARFQDGDTLLHIAAEFDRGEMLTWLVNECKIDIDLQNSEGLTPLATAALHDSHNAMTVFLNLGAEYKRILSARMATYLANVSGESMISHFTRLRDVLEREWGFLPITPRACPSLTELLDGSFSFFDDQFPESELRIAPIFASILGNNLAALQEFLQYGCSQESSCIMAQMCISRQTPLHLACTAIQRPCYLYPCSRLDPETPDFSLPMLAETRLCMLRLLVSYGFTNFNAQDTLGKTTLHHCAGQLDCLPVMQALVLEFEADLEIQDVQLMTPLHHITAMKGQDLDYLKFCLSRLSDDAIDKPDVHGHTPLIWCATVQRGKNSIDFCNYLIARGCSLALQSRYGATILHLATREPGDDELFGYIYDKVVGLDLLSALSDLVDMHGRTFAHTMARSENPKIRHHLQRLPPNILRELVNKPDLAGLTPLHEAVLAGDEELARNLMGHGGDIHQKAMDHLSLICIAHAAGHSAIVELLQRETNLSTKDKEVWTSERWTRTMSKLEEEEYARMEKVQDKVDAETESRKRLYKTV